MITCRCGEGGAECDIFAATGGAISPSDGGKYRQARPVQSLFKQDELVSPIASFSEDAASETVCMLRWLMELRSASKIEVHARPCKRESSVENTNAIEREQGYRSAKQIGMEKHCCREEGAGLEIQICDKTKFVTQEIAIQKLRRQSDTNQSLAECFQMNLAL